MLGFWDWFRRVFGFSPWLYHVEPLGDRDTPPLFAIVRRSKRSLACQEYLAFSGEWVSGTPPHLVHDSAVRTFDIPDEPPPMVYATYEHAERHVQRLEIGIPKRWPIVAAIVAIAGVAATIANAVARWIGCQ